MYLCFSSMRASKLLPLYFFNNFCSEWVIGAVLFHKTPIALALRAHGTIVDLIGFTCAIKRLYILKRNPQRAFRLCQYRPFLPIFPFN